MKIVSPLASSHSIKLIPRFYPYDAISFYLKKESTKVETLVSATYSIEGGVMLLDFDFTFAESEKYQIKIKQSDSVVYRGKLLATDQ